MQGILIDLDGVVYQNNHLIAGAAAAVDWFQRRSIPHLFVTNTTSKPRSTIVDKLSSLGIVVSEESILTPIVAAQHYLASLSDPKLALFVADDSLCEFAKWSSCGDSEQTVQAVILGDLGEQWDFAKLNRAFRILMRDEATELIALGMTRYWRGGMGLQLDVGPFVEALAFATGKIPQVLGKPAPLFFQMAATILNCPVRQLAMIGDDARSDVAAAQQSGLLGILVKTGKFRPTDLTDINADRVLDSIAQLPDLWCELE